MSKTKLSLALGSLLTLTVPAVVSAHTSDYSSVDYTTGTNSLGTGPAIGILIFFIVLLVIIIGFFVFWLFMLIDALKRTKWENDSDRMLWIIILSVSLVFGLSWLASVVYYFVVKKKMDKKKSRKK